MQAKCLKIAMYHFIEEMEGIDAYTESMVKVTDPQLKQLLQSTMVAEKEHARKLLGWITANAASALA